MDVIPVLVITSPISDGHCSFDAYIMRYQFRPNIFVSVYFISFCFNMYLNIEFVNKYFYTDLLSFLSLEALSKLVEDKYFKLILLFSEKISRNISLELSAKQKADNSHGMLSLKFLWKKNKKKEAVACSSCD